MLDRAARPAGDKPALAPREPDPRRGFERGARGRTFSEPRVFLFGIENQGWHVGKRPCPGGGSFQLLQRLAALADTAKIDLLDRTPHRGPQMFELLIADLHAIKAQLLELRASGEDTQRGTQSSELDVLQVLEKWDELPARVKESILRLVKEDKRA